MNCPSKDKALAIVVCSLARSTTGVVDRGGETPNPYGKPIVNWFMPKYYLVAELDNKW